MNSPAIGCVPYLNARPLICGMEDRTRLAVPSELSRQLREGQIDVALVPIVEYLEWPHYRIMPGIAIASRGPVQSVYIAHRKPLKEIRTLQLDLSSKTSNLLARVILACFLQQKVECGFSRDADAQLLIGDPALQQRARLLSEGWELFDLGEAWTRHTGLPFVYAFWAAREGVKAEAYLPLLHEAKETGLAQLEAISSAQQIIEPAAALNYLRNHVSYDLGEDEWKGFREFQRLGVEQKWIQPSGMNLVEISATMEE